MTTSNDFFEKAKLAIEKCEKKPEAKLEIEFEHVLKNYLEWLGFSDIEGQYEQKTGNILVVTKKKQDATYGKVIIEYESLGKLSTSYGRNHALNQIRIDYLSSYPKEQRRDMVGIVFDGKTVIFVRWIEDNWDDEEREFSRQSFDMMVNYLVGLYKISFKELPSQFSLNRTETRRAMKTLYEKSFKDDQRAKMLFNEWNLRFSSIYGNAFNKEKIKEHFRDFAKEIGIENVEGNRLVFVIHTYYAFIVKVIASEVAKNLFEYVPQSHMKTLLESEALEKDLREIEDGKFFRDIGVENFIEGTFLSWYLDVWDNDIKEVSQGVIAKLDWFDFAEFITKPEYVVDYLKNFYQEVFPKQLRHDLGEFYTPDWLATYVVNQAGFDGDKSKRILDPACGSGTFLVAILNKIYKKNKKEPQKEKLIAHITQNIVGFDINPVAVLTARTNYLIALSRFNLQRTRITIPIYLTDSIVLPELAKQTKLTDKAKLYNIRTTKGVFAIPADIKNQVTPVMQFLKDNIEKNQDISDVEEQLEDRFGFDDKVVHHLSELYNRLKDLSSRNQNKIWCDIMINQFATLFQGKFDFVIGNPPWVNWEFLDDEYQKHLLKINDDYGLYFTKGLESRLGKIKRDLSAIFFYVCSDVYLKDAGTIAFLIKPMYQIPSGAGFRNFNRLNKKMGIVKLKTPLKAVLVEGLTKENPFEIHNEVSMIVARKGEKTKYPITYKKWTGKRTHELEDYKAEPSDKKDELSSWIIYSGKKPVSILGEFTYTRREGTNFGLKEAFYDIELLIDKGSFVQIRNNTGKVKDIEKTKVYPLVMSRHVKKWTLHDKNSQKYTYCILPQTHPSESNEKELKRECPKTWGWLNDFRKQLLERKSKAFTKEPFYSIYGLGDWDAKYKVVWKSMGFYPDFVVVSSVNDKILGKKGVIAEHVLYFIPLDTEDEAHYVCAVLNSTLVRENLKVLSSKGKSGLSGSIVGKMKLEKFDSKNKMHKKLADLSKKAHELADKSDKALKDVEGKIDLLTEELCRV